MSAPTPFPPETPYNTGNRSVLPHGAPPALKIRFPTYAIHRPRRLCRSLDSLHNSAANATLPVHPPSPAAEFHISFPKDLLSLPQNPAHEYPPHRACLPAELSHLPPDLHSDLPSDPCFPHAVLRTTAESDLLPAIPAMATVAKHSCFLSPEQTDSSSHLLPARASSTLFVWTLSARFLTVLQTIPVSGTPLHTFQSPCMN